MFLSTMTSCSADKKSLPPNGYLYCGYFMVLDMTTIILVDSFLRNVVVVEEVGMA